VFIMASAFSQLKKSSQSSLQNLTKELGKMNESAGAGSSNGPDERFWKLSVDKAQNGHAVIRFLPASSNETVPWVRMFSHGFQGPGGWYIENSLTTIGQKDPVSEYNTKLWNSGVESDKEIARKQKRKLQYISNIYVVSDPSNPDNEGKVFLFKYGKKIFDMINDKMNPEFEDETAVNPFDLWNGCNFRLRARKVAGYRNYDKSEFDSSSALNEDDEELERIWNSQYSLEELIAPDQFKSYDELKTRFEKAIGIGEVSRASTETGFEEETASYEESASTSEDDDSLDYFKKLAEDV
jgi:hypothetical protein